MAQTDSRVRALYIHVPFCARKCAYCAFYSEALQGELTDRYLTALFLEMERVAHDLAPRTIFFGGGTPSLLTLRQWERVFGVLERFGWLGAQEITVECNPATVSLDKARLWREAGVNRVSLGMQSLDATLLERLGRVHTRAAAFRSFDLLRRAGLENVNVDLMFAIPGQTIEVWHRTLDEALALGSEHLSCYEVIYEEDTPLFAQLKAGRFAVDEDLACVMYEELVERAGAAGFHHYEIANFARDTRRDADADHGANGVAGGVGAAAGTSLLPAFACRHNVNYWRGGDFYGLGPSAMTSVRGVRTQNVSDTRRYCEALEQGRRAIAFREALPPLTRAGETAAFGLRMTQGWGFDEFRGVTGFDLREEWAADMETVTARGWGRIEPDRFRLTSTGLRFADAAAEYFLR